MGSTCGVIVGIAFLINNISSAIYIGVYSVASLVGGTLNYKLETALTQADGVPTVTIS